VTQNANGDYFAEVGNETFDAETDLSAMDGKILAVAKKREFPDVTLTRAAIQSAIRACGRAPVFRRESNSISTSCKVKLGLQVRVENIMSGELLRIDNCAAMKNEHTHPVLRISLNWPYS
jgi:hypothetical protein